MNEKKTYYGRPDTSPVSTVALSFIGQSSILFSRLDDLLSVWGERERNTLVMARAQGKKNVVILTSKGLSLFFKLFLVFQFLFQFALKMSGSSRKFIRMRQNTNLDVFKTK